MTTRPVRKRGTARDFVLKTVRATPQTTIDVLGQNDHFVEYRPNLDPEKHHFPAARRPAHPRHARPASPRLGPVALPHCHPPHQRRGSLHPSHRSHSPTNPHRPNRHPPRRLAATRPTANRHRRSLPSPSTPASSPAKTPNPASSAGSRSPLYAPPPIAGAFMQPSADFIADPTLQQSMQR